MSTRLRRIELAIIALTATAVAISVASETLRPLGVAAGGATALLDFVVIRLLVTAAFARRPSVSRAIPLAFAKSVALVLIPAAALLLPAGLIDGRSFAVGVTMLPLAVVVDALTPLAPQRA